MYFVENHFAPLNRANNLLNPIYFIIIVIVVFGMATNDRNNTALYTRDGTGQSRTPQESTDSLNLYMELTQTDITSLINIVSELQNINSAEGQLMTLLLERLEGFLGIYGSALGIYYPANHDNQFIAATMDLDIIPNFGTYPCALNGVLSSNSEKGACTIFFDSQDADFYTYLCLEVNVNLLQKRQRQILNFILPYLYACMQRLHLVSRRLADFGLTTREQEVVRWIIEGKDNWSISKILNVSERTVKFHNCNIYKKFGVSAKAEVICEYHKLITSLNQYQMKERKQALRNV